MLSSVWGIRMTRLAPVVFLLILLLAGGAGAREDGADRNPVWTLDEAVEQVEALYPGRILSARENDGEGSVRVFVVRILTENQEVRTLRIEQGTEVRR